MYPGLIGTLGEGQVHLQAAFECAPCNSKTCLYSGHAAVRPACYRKLSPAAVWSALQELATRVPGPGGRGQVTG